MNQRIYITMITLVCVMCAQVAHAQLLDETFRNLQLTRPVFLSHSGDGTDRIFVVEQSGIIKVFPNDPNVGSATVFLDIEGRVNDGGNEMGLLGLAFHPNYADNGFFYVNYTTGSNDTRRTVVSRFEVSENDPNSADENSELILLEVGQPFSNHNAGMIEFGTDGFLYISMGDGGSGGDPLDNGQDPTTLLGSILRIDVDNPSGGLNYGIPADNPFVNDANGRDEIFAYGLRNPWRFSIDKATGEIWAGDVGQGSFEEIDLIENGANYGWNIMEGFDCFNSSSCNMSGLTLPIVDYPHTQSGEFIGCSVTGGYVYRGTRRPELVGAYIYGDFCSGNIWLLRYENGQVVADSLLLEGGSAGNPDIAIASFGVDANNELYVLDLDNGNIYEFVDNTTHIDDTPGDIPESFGLHQNYPNPFNPTTVIRYELPRAGDVRLTIYNTLGQKIRNLVSEHREAGVHQVAWNGKDELGRIVPSGVYFYRLEAGATGKTRKMILMQ